ncbi:hypothetical protein CLS_02430 [[Clostridium] cf. saccharolyticum K10]|nr:hypothetical protein CLS_02430 [[Clostridium] cf. saccharolyticum K10]
MERKKRTGQYGKKA